MNEIIKDKIHALLRRFSLRILNPKSYRYEHDAANYHELADSKEIVIFDIGANIGQTSLAFQSSFPSARIYAFEPFEAVYKTLCKNVRSSPSIATFQLALGSVDKTIITRRVADPEAQTNQVTPAPTDATDTESVQISTIDQFCQSKGLSRIDILKTDTEGSDLEVLKGAESLLAAGRIGAILSEASIRADDRQHSNYRELLQYLQLHNYELFSIYSIRHDAFGQIDYFNALFKPRSLCGGISI